MDIQNPRSGISLAKYKSQMEIIKNRINTIELILSTSSKYTTPYPYTNIELCALQLRKIIESIILSSLVANSDIYNRTFRKLAKAWNASNIYKELVKLNPRFFPEPIRIIKHPERRKEYSDGSVDTGDKFVRKDGYITAEEAIEILGRIGKFMHATNPFSDEVDIDYYEKLVFETSQRIKQLLSIHLVHFIDESGMYYVAMAEAKTNNVVVGIFSKVAD